MRVNSNISSQVCVYDFASDPSAGAIGSVALGFNIPAGALVCVNFFEHYIVTPFASPGAATISITAWTNDLATNVPVIPNGIVYGPTSIATINASVPGTFLSGRFRNAYFNNIDLHFEIGTAPITAGKMIIVVGYIEVPKLW